VGGVGGGGGGGRIIVQVAGLSERTQPLFCSFVTENKLN